MGGDGFGGRLRWARDQARLTQLQLAERAGMDRVSLARIEGGGDTKASHAVALYEALAERIPDLSLVWLLTGSGPRVAGRVDFVNPSRRRFLRIGAATAASLAFPGGVELDAEQRSKGTTPELQTRLH